MTGPSLAPLIIPIAGTLFLTAWLTLVFFAGRLPRRAAGHPAPGPEGPGPAGTPHSSPQRIGDVRVVFEVER
jgi:hypothetical protein